MFVFGCDNLVHAVLYSSSSLLMLTKPNELPNYSLKCHTAKSPALFEAANKARMSAPKFGKLKPEAGDA